MAESKVHAAAGKPKAQAFRMGPYPNRIHAIRIANGVMVQAIDGSGISRPTFRQYEHGQRPLDDAHAALIAKLLRCAIDDLRAKGDEAAPVPNGRALVKRAPTSVAVRQVRPAKASTVELSIALDGEVIGGLTLNAERAWPFVKRVLRHAFDD